MRCPRCGCLDDKVMETRISKDGDAIRRRRECASCTFRFTTRETVVPAEFTVVKRDGTREEFNPEKLCSGIKRACWKRSVSENQIEAIVGTIIRDLLTLQNREVSSRTIGERVMRELQKVDEVAYVRFASVYRQFCNVGEFISEVQSLGDKSDLSDRQEEDSEHATRDPT